MTFEVFTDDVYFSFKDADFESGLARARRYLGGYIGEEVTVSEQPWYTAYRSTVYPMLGSAGAEVGKVAVTEV